MVLETDYLSHFWRSHAWVPQASLQADSALTHRQEQNSQYPRRTRWPQEKGRGAISPDSRASHPLHSYAVGYYSRLKYDVPWNWLRDECHVARVCWEARCKGFCSKESPHYQMEWSVRNQLERNQVQRYLRSRPAAVFRQATINLFTRLEIPWRFQSQTVLRWLSGGLCHARKCQFEDLDKKKRYDLRLVQWTFAWETFAKKGRMGKECRYLSGTRFPRASYFEKMRNVCQKHGGACMTWYPEYKRYENRIKNQSPVQPRKVQRN